MSSTVSVSKGCFAFPRKVKGKDTRGQYPKEPWYNAYKKAWTSFEVELKDIENKSLKEILKGVINYVAESLNQKRQNDEIPSAALLTGVNMTDHTTLFSTLTEELKKEVTPHVAVLWAQDCNSIKTAVEKLCSQFMTIDESDEDLDQVDLEEEIKGVNSGISKVHCNFPVLLRWYKKLSRNEVIYYKNKQLQNEGAGKPLVVVIPNFECFSRKVLQDFILILSANRKTIPLMLILGVATSVSAVHRSLPHHVSSKMCIQVFHTEPTSAYLSKILDSVILSPERPFHLGSKTFNTLLDVFLLYDFSVSGFIQGFKFCMTEHFYGKMWTALCCHKSELAAKVRSLTRDEVESIIKRPSLRRHIECLPKAEKLSWLENDEFVRGSVLKERASGQGKITKPFHTKIYTVRLEPCLQKEILQFLYVLHDACSTFYKALRSLQVLLLGLPKHPFGKHLRDLYATAIATNITSLPDYQDCMKLLRFTAKDELIEKLDEIFVLFSEDDHLDEDLREFAEELEELTLELKCLDDDILTAESPSKIGLRTPTKSPMTSPGKGGLRSPPKNRSQLKEKISEMAELKKAQQSPFEKLREAVLALLESLWKKALEPPTTRVLHEVMFFDDLSAVRPCIIGTPRRAVQTALTEPHSYLQCDCCQLSSPTDIAPSLPDLSIVYKLHLESGRHINMYDWLQAYLTIVNPNVTGDEQTEVDPKLQARFTRAVAELQFLGYIKSSTRKTDHVMRLTWN